MSLGINFRIQLKHILKLRNKTRENFNLMTSGWSCLLRKNVFSMWWLVPPHNATHAIRLEHSKIHSHIPIHQQYVPQNTHFNWWQLPHVVAVIAVVVAVIVESLKKIFNFFRIGNVTKICLKFTLINVIVYHNQDTHIDMSGK